MMTDDTLKLKNAMRETFGINHTTGETRVAVNDHQNGTKTVHIGINAYDMSLHTNRNTQVFLDSEPITLSNTYMLYPTADRVQDESFPVITKTTRIKRNKHKTKLQKQARKRNRK